METGIGIGISGIILAEDVMEFEIAGFSADSIIDELEKIKKPIGDLSIEEGKKLKKDIEDIILDNIGNEMD